MRELSFTGAPLPGDPQFLEWVRVSLFEIMNASRDGENDDPTVYAPLDDPDLTGTPTAPTADPGTSTTQIATTAFVVGEVGAEATARASAIASAVATETAAREAAIDALAVVDIDGLQTALDSKEPTITAGGTGDYWRGDKTWQPLPAQPNSWRAAIKSAGQTRNSSVAWVDVTDLTFAVEAGTYAFDFIVPCTTGAGGLQLGVNGPTLTTLYAGIANNSSTIITAYDTSILTVSSGNVLARIHGGVTFSAAGTFALRMRQNTSNAADSTINGGASLAWARA